MKQLIILTTLIIIVLSSFAIPEKVRADDNDLKTIILADCPALSDNITTFEKVNIIRDWAANTFPPHSARL